MTRLPIAFTPFIALLFSAAAPACSSAPTADAQNQPPPPRIAFSMSVTVPASSEVHRCQFVRMPTTGANIFIGGASHEYTPGSHHFLIYRTGLHAIPAGMADQLDCFEGSAKDAPSFGTAGVMQYARGYVAGGQTPKDSYDFPAGIALPYDSGEVLLFQAHYVNATTAPIAAKVDVQLHTVAEATVKQRAGVLRYYDPFIYVAPKSSAKATMRCHVKQDITIVGAGPHMHKRAIGFEAFLDAPGGSMSTTPFYESADWEHPKHFQGPLTIKAGSAVRFGCNYKNDLDKPFIQGVSAENDEMCMFTAIYYPAMATDDEDCHDMDLHGSGTAACKDTTACIQKCPLPDFEGIPPKINECWQKCIVGSCPNASTALFPQLRCAQDHCMSECSGAADKCVPCMIKSCLKEAAACQGQVCGPAI